MKLRSALISIGFVGLLAIPFFLAMPILAQPVPFTQQGEISFKRGFVDSINSLNEGFFLNMQLSDGSEQYAIIKVVTNLATRITPRIQELGTDMSKWPRGLLLNVLGIPKTPGDNELYVLAKQVEVDTKDDFVKKYKGSVEQVRADQGFIYVVLRDGKGYKFNYVSREGNGGNQVRFVRVNGRVEEPVPLTAIQAGDPAELVELWRRTSRTSNDKVSELVVRLSARPRENNILRVLRLEENPSFRSITIKAANKVAVQNDYQSTMYLFARAGQRGRFAPPAGVDLFLGEVGAGKVSRSLSINAGDPSGNGPVSIFAYNNRQPAGRQPIVEFTIQVQP